MANRISREKLIKIGLSNEQMEKIVALHGADIEELKAKSDELINSKTEELRKANESLQSQIAERDKDLKSLKKQAGDNEELGNKFKELQDKYKHDTEDLTKELQQTKLNSAVDSALGAAKARNTKATKALLNMDNVKLNDKGELEGLEDQINELQKSASYLFDQGTKEPYKPQGGDGNTDPDPVTTMTDIFKGADNK